jgi:hemin uptake protein HemP
MKLQAACNLKSILILMNKISKIEQFETEDKMANYSSPMSVNGAATRVVKSEDLFASENEIGIVHQGSMYRLRITRGGKLILNK